MRELGKEHRDGSQGDSHLRNSTMSLRSFLVIPQFYSPLDRHSRRIRSSISDLFTSRGSFESLV